MKQNILKLPAIVLATTLAGSVQAAADKQKDSHSTSSEPRQQQQAERTSPKLTDENIHSAVEKKLKQLDGIDTSQLEVKANNRTITVTGTVNSLIESERILETVSATRGVENVMTRFTVEPEKRSDGEIERDVNAALDFDPATTARDIKVNVDHGEVRLSGKAGTWSEKQLATWVASEVRGVRKINNDLTVASPERSDAEIKAALQQRFRSDPLVSDEISVTVTNGHVRLSGEVGSALENQWAISDARALNVANVDASQLRVKPESRDSVSRSETKLSDEDIAESIRHAYVNDPRVFSFNPDVQVKNGDVTLKGTVDNLKAREAAVQIARNIAGVKQVTNKLSLRGEHLADGYVAQSLRDALQRSVLVDAEDITVNVNDGRATLGGDVDSYFEKWAAGDIAARTRGVTKIQNQLIRDDLPEFMASSSYYYYPWHSSYYPWTYSSSDKRKTDWELLADVRDHLTWSPFTDAEDISIAVNSGVVTLTGEVDNRMEKAAAEDNAYQAGATRVKNQLVVLEPTGR
jgi:osmotically-inducible protein OsmY